MMNTKSDASEVQLNDKYNSIIQQLEIAICEEKDQVVSTNLSKKLAEAHLKEGNYFRALNLYIKILGEEPTNARIWNKLAATFIHLEEFDLAVDMSRIAFQMINSEHK